MTIDAEHGRAMAERFRAALSAGSIPDDLFTPDARVWTVTSLAWSPGERFRMGIGLLATFFPDGLTYAIDHVTADGGRVAVEMHSRGTLASGDVFDGVYVFILGLEGERICEVREFSNPEPVQRLISPLMAAALASAARSQDQ